MEKISDLSDRVAGVFRDESPTAVVLRRAFAAPHSAEWRNGRGQGLKILAG
jgi:hypothetical protein